MTESITVERERGTLRKTLPRHPEYLFALFHFCSTGVAVLCCRSQPSVREAWPALIVGSALSSLATIGGIVYADSAVHSFLLGLAVSRLAVIGATLHIMYLSNQQSYLFISPFFLQDSCYIHCQWHCYWKRRTADDECSLVAFAGHVSCCPCLEASNDELGYHASLCNQVRLESNHDCFHVQSTSCIISHGRRHVNGTRLHSQPSCCVLTNNRVSQHCHGKCQPVCRNGVGTTRKLSYWSTIYACHGNFCIVWIILSQSLP